ncbi:uncharacterized protein [Misgurnus anguillicaudatus]|uniref:uncharacterized protein isoform X1 n=1 Tax=Misgurnus anguillicaudatus TaxID=75329 RepID=UPI003CCF36EF
MSKLQDLSVFLTDRLTLAAQEIFKAVEDVFSEYNEEICRSRNEIELLRRRLQQAGLQIDSETQFCSNEAQDMKTCTEEQWRCEQNENDTNVHVKLEVYTQQEENDVQMSVCNELKTLLLPCMDTDHDQMASKNIESQMTDDSENDFPLIYQYAQIKNEPGLYTEEGSTNKAQHFTRHSSEDPGGSGASSSKNTKICHTDSFAHTTQEFNLPFRNQEMLKQQKMELAQKRKRTPSQSSVCHNEVSKSDKVKIVKARYYQVWRDRLKNDPVKYADYKASEAARLREYRRRMSATSLEMFRKQNCENQRRFRARKKLQQCKADKEPKPPN